PLARIERGLHLAKADTPRYAALAVRALQRYGSLSGTDETHIREAVADAEVRAAGSELIAEGEPLDRARIVLAGWAARVRMLSDGRRQILSFLLPGDTYGIAARPCGFAPCAISALT